MSESSPNNALVLQQQNPNAIIVSRRQQGNPVLSYIRNIRWLYGDITPDYLVGQYAAALFLSLRYHQLHPNYLRTRLQDCRRSFRLLVLVCHVDTEDPERPLADVSRLCLLGSCTLLCAWSHEECARWIETIKCYEHKPAAAIQERSPASSDSLGRLTHALGAVRGVNKTDAASLAAQFTSVGDLFKATPEQLSECPGLGPTKVRRLFEAFHQPFRKDLDPRKEGEGRQGARGLGGGGLVRRGPGEGAEPTKRNFRKEGENREIKTNEKRKRDNAEEAERKRLGVLETSENVDGARDSNEIVDAIKENEQAETEASENVNGLEAKKPVTTNASVNPSKNSLLTTSNSNNKGHVTSLGPLQQQCIFESEFDVYDDTESDFI